MAPDEQEPNVRNEVSGMVGGNVYQAREITIHNVGEAIRAFPSRPRVTPDDLPPEPRYFVDREPETERITSLVTDPDNTGAPAIVISGLPGVGSSAVARHWGNRQRHRYPDGNLYADLDEHRVGNVVSLKTILTNWLLSCGVQKAELADDLPGLRDQFRRLTRGRRILVVADHAHNEAEVTQLCPPSPGSALIATSFRMDKFALDLEHLPLKPLPEKASRALVSKLIGAGRASAEPGAVTELIGLCDRMPQALRMALARMRRDEDLTVADVAAGLRSDVEQRPDATRRRKSVLDANAARNYEALSAVAAFLFRSLAWHPGPDVSGDAVGAMGERHGFDAREALDELLDLHLLDRHASKRYRMLPSVRAYGRKRSAEMDGDDAETRALAVWADWYLARARAADRRITPNRNRVFSHEGDPGAGFATAAAARDWFAVERHALLALQRQCSVLGRFETVLRLGEPLWLMYLGNRDIAAFLDSMKLCVDAAVAVGNVIAEVRFRTFWARAFMEDGQFEAAGRELALALEKSTAEGVPAELHASTIEFTGRWHAYQGRYRQAIEQYQRARVLFTAEAERSDVSEEAREANRRGVALQDHFIGRCLLRLGEPREAVERLRRAETNMAGEGRERDLATIRTDLGEALRLAGEVDGAFAVVTAAVGLLAGKGWYRIEADALWQLVYLAEARGDRSLERDCLERLRNLYEHSGGERVDEVTRRLSALDEG